MCYRAHAPARSDSAYHLSTQVFNATFLTMTVLTKNLKPYFKCSAIAETQVFAHC